MLFLNRTELNDRELVRSVHVYDPLGQTHSPASSDHYSHVKVVLFCDILKSGRTCVKIVFTTDHNCGSASWIKNHHAMPCNLINSKAVPLFTIVSFHFWSRIVCGFP